jgi:hypothetical protein
MAVDSGPGDPLGSGPGHHEAASGAKANPNDTPACGGTAAAPLSETGRHVAVKAFAAPAAEPSQVVPLHPQLIFPQADGSGQAGSGFQRGREGPLCDSPCRGAVIGHDRALPRRRRRYPAPGSGQRGRLHMS